MLSSGGKLRADRNVNMSVGRRSPSPALNRDLALRTASIGASLDAVRHDSINNGDEKGEQEGKDVNMTYDLLSELVKVGFHVPDELEASCRTAIGVSIDISQSVFPGTVRVLMEAVEKVCNT